MRQLSNAMIPSLPSAAGVVLSLALVLALVLLAGCVSMPPRNTANACSIFQEKDGWHAAALASQRRWGVPVPVLMAIMNQESSFVEDARPPRYRFLGILPLWHLSSAYGYGQVKDETWDWYLAKSGNDGADRDEFGDVTDFIGWYVHQSYLRLRIPKSDAYRNYLVYHEGHGGFERNSYRAKPWLMAVARRVAATAQNYQRQLLACRGGLEGAISVR